MESFKNAEDGRRGETSIKIKGFFHACLPFFFADLVILQVNKFGPKTHMVNVTKMYDMKT